MDENTTSSSQLETLRRLELIDAPAHAAYDKIINLLAKSLNTPVALLSILDFPGDRQFFKGQQGLGQPWSDKGQTPLSHSFCQHVVRNNKTLVVENAPDHPLVRDNKAVDELGVAAYLGAPIYLPDGSPAGALCAIDTKPRTWSQNEKDLLSALADCVSQTVRLTSDVKAAEEIKRSAQIVATRDEERKQVLWGIFEELPWAVTVFDAENYLRYFNPAYDALNPENSEPLKEGMHLSDVLKTAAREGKFDLKGLSPAEWVEQKLQQRQDESATMDVQLSDGRILERICILLTDGWEVVIRRDVTDLRAKDAEIARQQQDLIAVNAELADNISDLQRNQEDLERFSHAAVHDIKAPLRGIRNLLDIVSQDYKNEIPPDALDLIEMSKGSASRLQTLVSDLLQHAKSGSKHLSIQEIDLSVLIEKLKSDHHDWVSGFKLTLFVSQDLPKILADSSLVYLIFENLIENSLKYRDQNRDPFVSIEADQDKNAIKFTDNGIGFDATKAEQIFEPFKRLHRSSDIEGSGIGLATCKAICDRHGWTISATGKPGKGAEFTICLLEQF